MEADALTASSILTTAADTDWSNSDLGDDLLLLDSSLSKSEEEGGWSPREAVKAFSELSDSQMEGLALNVSVASNEQHLVEGITSRLGAQDRSGEQLARFAQVIPNNGDMTHFAQQTARNATSVPARIAFVTLVVNNVKPRSFEGQPQTQAAAIVLMSLQGGDRSAALSNLQQAQGDDAVREVLREEKRLQQRDPVPPSEKPASQPDENYAYLMVTNALPTFADQAGHLILSGTDVWLKASGGGDRDYSGAPLVLDVAELGGGAVLGGMAMAGGVAAGLAAGVAVPLAGYSIVEPLTRGAKAESAGNAGAGLLWMGLGLGLNRVAGGASPKGGLPTPEKPPATSKPLTTETPAPTPTAKGTLPKPSPGERIDYDMHRVLVRFGKHEAVTPELAQRHAEFPDVHGTKHAHRDFSSDFKFQDVTVDGKPGRAFNLPYGDNVKVSGVVMEDGTLVDLSMRLRNSALREAGVRGNDLLFSLFARLEREGIAVNRIEMHFPNNPDYQSNWNVAMEVLKPLTNLDLPSEIARVATSAQLYEAAMTARVNQFFGDLGFDLDPASMHMDSWGNLLGMRNRSTP